ncbi:hypothetical protein NUSPORA_00326 [Nucleospora cyclopteri]
MQNTHENFDYLFKIVLVGDTNVGKTNILARLTTNKFLGDSKPTIGVEFGTKLFKFGEDTIKAQIWDTAGQERYHAIISAYYRGACGAFLVYDVTNKDSFKNANGMWLINLKNSCNSDIPIMLLGNKADLKSERQVKTEIARDSALSNNMGFYETSAQSGLNIDKAFDKFIQEIYQKEKKNFNFKNKRKARREDLKGDELKLVSQKNQKRSCC